MRLRLSLQVVVVVVAPVVMALVAVAPLVMALVVVRAVGMGGSSLLAFPSASSLKTKNDAATQAAPSSQYAATTRRRAC